MREAKYAGKVMRSFSSRISEILAAQDFERQGELGRKLIRELIEAYSEEGPNWKRGNRLISDMHASQTDPQIGESWIGIERYTEDVTNDVRLSEFFDFEGNLIGRQYFDQGNVPMEEVKKHLREWESSVKRGRRPLESPLPFTDVEVFRKVEEIRQRGSQLRRHSTQGALMNAIGIFLFESGQLYDELSDLNHETLFRDNRRAYYRGQKKVKKKPG